MAVAIWFAFALLLGVKPADDALEFRKFLHHVRRKIAFRKQRRARRTTVSICT